MKNIIPTFFLLFSITSVAMDNRKTMNQYANLIKKIELYKDNLRVAASAKIKLHLPLHPSIEQIRQILYANGPFPTNDQLLEMAKCFLVSPVNLSDNSKLFYEEIKKTLTSIYGLRLSSKANNPNADYEAKKALSKLGNIPFKEWASYAIEVHEKPIELVQAILFINRSRMLTIENIKLLLNHPSPLKLAEIFQRLHKEKLDSPDYLTHISQYDNYDLFLDIIENLRLGGIVKLEYIRLAQEHPNPPNFSRALSYLSFSNALSKENLDFAIKHNSPEEICHGISFLGKGGIQNQNLFDIVKTHPAPVTLGKAIYQLSKVNISTEDNINILYNHPLPSEISKALFNLKKKNAYSPRNRQYVINARNSILVAQRLIDINPSILKIEQTAQLSPEAIESILNFTQNNAVNISAGEQLRLFDRAGILTQSNLCQLLDPSKIFLLGPQAIQSFWNRMPPHLLNQNRWNYILNITGIVADPLPLLIEFLQNILNLDEARHRPAFHNNRNGTGEINNAQSVHVDSVHASATKTANNLKKIYYPQLEVKGGVTAIISEMSNFFRQRQENSLEYNAAIRCLERIGNRENKFVDKGSDVTTRELLAYFWLGIHDEKERIASFDDSFHQLVIGLYEIQRGYNINFRGIDDGSLRDKEICTAGTFNKLIEKLVGIHSQAEMRLITSAGAAMKLPALVKEVAIAYLKEHKEMLDQTIESGIDVIWDNIKEEVGNQLFEEYKSIYKSIKDSEFLELIENGQWVDLSDLKLEKMRIQDSESNSKKRPRNVDENIDNPIPLLPYFLDLE